MWVEIYNGVDVGIKEQAEKNLAGQMTKRKQIQEINPKNLSLSERFIKIAMKESTMNLK